MVGVWSWLWFGVCKRWIFEKDVTKYGVWTDGCGVCVCVCVDGRTDGYVKNEKHKTHFFSHLYRVCLMEWHLNFACSSHTIDRSITT